MSAITFLSLVRLDEGWNQGETIIKYFQLLQNLVQFNLADFVRRAYGTLYVETLRIQIHANCRLRRVYFADRMIII